MSSSSPSPESWISAFCALVGHEYFAEVTEDFVEDDFNLTGLQSQVPMYKEALEMILDVEPEDASDEDEEDEEEEDDDDDMQDGMDAAYRRDTAAERRHLRMAADLGVIESSAEMLYGLIHQRYITSRTGIQQMAEKYELGHFGHCPRVHCHAAKVLPVGCSDIPGQETVKLFCPSCLDVYTPPNSRFQSVDGAFFGTTFGCLFFMTFPDLDVGGRNPPAYDDVASSLNGANGQQASSRSLSSSLTSQAPAGGPTSSSNSSHPPPPQPGTINGVATRNLAPGLGPGRVYEPRIYGFRVSELARMGPRMKWLRSRPTSVADLDESRFFAQQQQQIRLAQQAQQLQRPGTAPSAETADFDDSEMLDPEPDEDAEGAEIDDVDENADLGDNGQEAHLREIAQRKKTGRRRQHSQLSDAWPTGDVGGGGGGAAVRVGDGG